MLVANRLPGAAPHVQRLFIDPPGEVQGDEQPVLWLDDGCTLSHYSRVYGFRIYGCTGGFSIKFLIKDFSQQGRNSPGSALLYCVVY